MIIHQMDMVTAFGNGMLDEESTWSSLQGTLQARSQDF